METLKKSDTYSQVHKQETFLNTALVDHDHSHYHSIKELLEALEIQKKKLGRHNASVTKMLHALALEYKAQERYDKSILCIREAITILDERLEKLLQEVIDEMETTHVQDFMVTGNSKYNFIKENASNITRSYMTHLLEEKSVMYSCLANMYKKRRMYKEAMDNYLQSLSMLVEADFPGESPRVSMMVRIMKRAEHERKMEELKKFGT